MWKITKVSGVEWLWIQTPQTFGFTPKYLKVKGA